MSSKLAWRTALESLAHKYRELRRLCSERDGFEAAGIARLTGEVQAERQARARALARRFPGALRELDGATMGGLTARLSAIEGEIVLAREPDAAPRWMRIVVDFHGELAELLAIKGAIARGEEVLEADAGRVAEPPYGRLQELVWQRLMERYGLERSVLLAIVHGGES